METKVHNFSHLNQTSQKKALSIANQRVPVSENEHYIPEPYKKVARGMEEQFANFMLEEMNKTTGDSSTDSASQYYKGLMTAERAKIMSESDQGLGLKKVILEQIYPKRLRNKIAFENFVARDKAQQAMLKKNSIEMYKKADRTQQLDQLSNSIDHREGN